MKLLAIETASEACSTALYNDGEIVERYKLAPREQSRLILPMVESLLNEAGYTLRQLDALGFGCGPGSFTGLRIAAGVTQGLAFGADLPVVPVSTLAAMAQDMLPQCEEEYAFCALDARLDEVYWGVYRSDDSNGVEAVGAEILSAPSGILLSTQSRGIALGEGWRAYRDELLQCFGKGQVQSIDTECKPRARAIAWLAARDWRQGRSVPAEQAQPVYLRDNVARKQNQQ